MGLCEEDHILIKNLHEFKGDEAKRLMKIITDKMMEKDYFERVFETFVRTMHDCSEVW